VSLQLMSEKGLYLVRILIRGSRKLYSTLQTPELKIAKAKTNEFILKRIKQD